MRKLSGKIPQDKPPKHRNPRKRLRYFVNALIVLCLAMCVYITVSTVQDYHRLDAVMGAGEIAALFVPWGGELLLIVVRQVLGSDLANKNKKEYDISEG